MAEGVLVSREEGCSGPSSSNIRMNCNKSFNCQRSPSHALQTWWGWLVKKFGKGMVDHMCGCGICVIRS